MSLRRADVLALELGALGEELETVNDGVVDADGEPRHGRSTAAPTRAVATSCCWRSSTCHTASPTAR